MVMWRPTVKEMESMLSCKMLLEAKNTITPPAIAETTTIINIGQNPFKCLGFWGDVWFGIFVSFSLLLIYYSTFLYFSKFLAFKQAAFINFWVKSF